MKKKLKVLQTIRQGKVGGGESHVLSLVRALDTSAFEPVVLSFTDGPMVEQLREMGVKSVVIPSLHAFDPRTWKKVRNLIRTEEIDLVHAHGTRSLTNVYFPSVRENVPLIYTVHGWSFHESLLFPIYYARLLAECWLTARVRQTLCVSEANVQYGKKHIPHFAADVVYNGIDLERFNPHRELMAVRKEYGIEQHQVVIGFLARLTVQKDPVSLVEAFGCVAKKYPEVVLLMIGEGELYDEVKSRISELGLENRIILDGFRQDVPEVLKAMDIFCLPSLWEGMPIGLIEALAMEKAVVATSVDGTSELLVDGVNGLLVPAQEPKRLAAALERLLENPELANRLRLQARPSILAQYGADAMARRIEQIYRRHSSAMPRDDGQI